MGLTIAFIRGVSYTAQVSEIQYNVLLSSRQQTSVPPEAMGERLMHFPKYASGTGLPLLLQPRSSLLLSYSMLSLPARRAWEKSIHGFEARVYKQSATLAPALDEWVVYDTSVLRKLELFHHKA